MSVFVRVRHGVEWVSGGIQSYAEWALGGPPRPPTMSKRRAVRVPGGAAAAAAAAAAAHTVPRRAVAG